MEGSKITYNLVNNDNVALFTLAKKFQKILLKELANKMISCTKLYTLKEQIQEVLISSTTLVAQQKAALSIP